MQDMNPKLLRGAVVLVLALIGPATGFSAHPELGSTRYGDGALAFSAGFIRQSVSSDGTVAQTFQNKQLLGKGDAVYLRLFNVNDVAPGALYTIYRRIHKVFHPASRRYLGDLISVLGVVQVNRISQGFAVASVVRSYSAMAPGDGVMPFESGSPDETASADVALPEEPGMIVDLQVQRTLIAQNHHAFVDWGRDDGLHLGDRLDVFRVRSGYPEQLIGEMKVIALEDQTATGLVVRSTTPFVRGDRFMPQLTSQRTAFNNERIDHPTDLDRATRTREDLTKSLKTEIAKGEVTVTQTGDKVTINLGDLVEQLEFESGEAPIKPTGVKILHQISEILRDMVNQQIEVEGHTDGMPIGPKLAARFRTNQELSEARASLIVRYFMEQGIDEHDLSAVGYADQRPVASNATEEGRRKNRRIEIELTPKHPSVPVSPELPALPADPQPMESSQADPPPQGQ